MAYYFKECNLVTKKKNNFYDITNAIINAVKKSKIKNGHVLVQTKHTTTSIYVNELEKLLCKDMQKYLDDAVINDAGYLHDNINKRKCPEDEPKNAESHIKAMLYGNNSVYLSLNSQQLQIGKWQRIFFAEFDGPCPRNNKDKRKYIISIIGE